MLQKASIPCGSLAANSYLPAIVPAHRSLSRDIIDAMNEELQPLKSFILPGGTSLNAYLHHARTVCRRAEREILKLKGIDLVSPEILKYINRLSDLLFVVGRWVTETLGEKETLWQPGKSKPDWNWN